METKNANSGNLLEPEQTIIFMGIDLVGSESKVVALVKLEEGSDNIEKIAEEIMKGNKNVKTVLQKVFGTKGDYRLKEGKIIRGEKDTEVLHKENGYLLKLDPKFVYFSPRESTIRKYVSEKIEPDEKVLLMFAGVGPYAASISKLQPKVKEITAVEWNPEAVKYMKENIRINKMAHLVTPIEGDVKEFCKNSDEKFDRIIMPMINAGNFLDVAEKTCKKGGTVHVYLKSLQEDHRDMEEFIAEKMNSFGREYEIEDVKRICIYAPGKWKVLFQIKMK